MDDEALGRVRRGGRHRRSFIPLEVYELVEHGDLAAGRRVRAQRVRGGLPALDQAAVRDPRRQGGLRGASGRTSRCSRSSGPRRAERERRGPGAGRASDRQAAAAQLGAQRPVAGEQDHVQPGPRPRRRRCPPCRRRTRTSPAAARSARASTLEDRRVRLGQPLGPGHHDVARTGPGSRSGPAPAGTARRTSWSARRRGRRPRAGRAAPRRWRRSARDAQREVRRR